MAMSRNARALLAVFAAVAALGAAGCGGSGSSSSDTSSGSGTSESGGGASGEPIVIGAAIDQSDFMSAFDDPALAAAQLEVAKINAAGGVDGHPLKFAVANTHLKPDQTKSAALNLIDKGADILWVTCDVDLATPAIQVGLSQKMLTVSPCIGTNQMGPKRFGDAGKLAFSFGNVAQDEGAALAELAMKKGWKTANVITDQSLVYFKDDCAAFKQRYQELGGKVLADETFTAADGSVNNVVSRVNGSKAQVEALCTTTTKDLPTFLSGLRSLGNQTPIVGPWSEDGSFWLPKDPKIANNMWVITYASIHGDDPSGDVKDLIAKMKSEGQAPTTGGFVTGAAAIDAIAAAIKQTNGSTDGAKLASVVEGFKDLPTVSGNVSFSPDLHSVFGRDYRIIAIKDGKPGYSGSIKASKPATTGS